MNGQIQKEVEQKPVSPLPPPIIIVHKQGEIELKPTESTRIENIRILEKLGGGNFGDVFHGMWNGTTDVALKQLKSKEHFQEFIQEASMLQSLNHPNIVRFFGIHTTSKGEHFIVMEYMQKGSLDGLLQMESKKISAIDLLSM